ncbi:Ger(x)C family spore germination protein [Radiobacillus sp. PE A8.2]|uniref:Ger(x)C family spore germination protein n=1 Tax=Radiobacillus sp. PE A8.2 TaxID=3380349 RepID=UPI00388FD4B9
MSKRIGSTFKTFLLMSILIFLSGCWDTKDINHRIMPVAVGISAEDDEYKIYLQIAKVNNGKIDTEVVIGQGRTVNQIVNNISADMEASVDLLHVKVIVVDNKIAERGLNDLVSGFMRSRDVSSKALMTIVEGDIDHFFQTMKQDPGKTETIPIDHFEKNSGWDPQIALTRVWQVYKSIHSNTQDTVIPMIALGETTLIKQIGSAVLKDGKVVETIDSNETLLFNALKEESAQGKIEVLDDASVVILGNTVDYQSKLIDSRPELIINLKFKVMVLETRGTTSEKLIKQQLRELLKVRFDSMFSELQEQQADIIGTGKFFRNKINSSDLSKWRSEYYPNLSYQFNVSVDIQNEGNLKEPSN